MGQKLGTRSWYVYTDETGREYATLRDDDLMDDLSDLPLLEAGEDLPPLGRFIQPRVIFWEDDTGARKTVPVSAEDGNYTSNVRDTVTFQDVEFTYVGRRGEAKTIPGVAAGEDTSGGTT